MVRIVEPNQSALLQSNTSTTSYISMVRIVEPNQSALLQLGRASMF